MLDATVDGHCAGWQMALHAIGDAAVDLAIEAFEKAHDGCPGRTRGTASSTAG